MAAIFTISKPGKEMAEDLKSNKVDAVILTATRGIGTRNGAVWAKEIERVGILLS